MDHGIFYPRALSDELLFEPRLAPASNAVIGYDETRINIQLSMKSFTVKNSLMRSCTKMDRDS